MEKRFNAPNCVTIIRLLLIIAMVYLLAASHGQIKIFPWIIGLLALNYAGDILDGYLARRFNQVTKLGAIMDVMVDAFLLLSAYFTLACRNVINYYLFYLTLASLLQFIFSSLWVKRFCNKKSVFTFDALGHYSIVLIEVMLIFNIASEFITASSYLRMVNSADVIVIIIGIAATINRFRFYFMVPNAVEA